MIGTKIEAMRMLGRGGWWMVALGLGLGMAGATSCLSASPGHCLYGGGDLACGSSEICVFALAGGEAPGVGDDGCVEGAEPPAEFFHAKYGLPARLEAGPSDPMDLASVEGLLRRLADGGATVDATTLASFEGETVDEVVRIRGLLTKDGGVVKTKRDLGPADEDAIDSYYAAVDVWLEQNPPGTGTDSESDTDTTETTVSGTMTSSGETSEPECTGNEMCPSERPFCGAAMECVTCDAMPMPDMACAGASAEAPLCVDGACVQCTAEDASVCTNAGLLCDEESGACVPCTEHEQCESGACELAAGTCFGPDGVVHVDGDGGQDFMTVVAAVNEVAAKGVGVIVVHEQDSGLGYPGVLIDGGKTLALLAAPGESPIVQGTGGNPGLRVEDAGTVLYMDGLSVAGNTMGLGVRVDGAVAWLDRSRIVQNSGGGIVAQNGAELTLRNCFVGGDVNDINALEVNGAAANILYTTAGGGFGNATALTCDGAATVTVRNSMFIARTGADEVTCDASIDDSATESNLGGTNTALGDMSTMWFVGYGTGDFHLTGSHPAAIDDAAQWTTGDPPTDIDGDPRPQMDGVADYAGADVP